MGQSLSYAKYGTLVEYVFPKEVRTESYIWVWMFGSQVNSSHLHGHALGFHL